MGTHFEPSLESQLYLKIRDNPGIEAQCAGKTNSDLKKKRVGGSKIKSAPQNVAIRSQKKKVFIKERFF